MVWLALFVVMSTQHLLYEEVICYGDDEDEMLSSHTSNVVYDGNQYLLLDIHQSAMIIPSTNESIGVFGQGPGECERPNTLVVWDEEMYGLLQSLPPKLVLRNLDNSLNDVIEFQGVFTGRNLVRVGDHVVLNTFYSNEEREPIYALSIYDLEGNLLKHVLKEICYQGFPRSAVRGSWCASEEQVFVAIEDRIDIYSLADGSFQYSIALDFRRELQGKEARFYEQWYPWRNSNLAFPIEVMYYNNGELYVLPSTYLEQEHLSFRVINLEDNSQSQIVFVGIEPRWNDFYILFDASRLAVIKGYKDARMKTDERDDQFVKVYERRDW